MILNFGRPWIFDTASTSNFFIRFQVPYRIAISEYKLMISKAKSLMSYMISVQCRDISIPKFFLRHQRLCRYQLLSGMICHTWGGWAHRPRSSPSHGSSPLVLDPLGRSVLLRDCLDALSCYLTRHTPRNVQCSCPSGAEKCTIDPVCAALIAIAAHKLNLRI